MPSCTVKWCRSHTNMKNTGLTFHIFPTNEIQRVKWINAVRLERNEFDWVPSNSSKICSIHFCSEDTYILNNGRRNRLKKSAVPICTMVRPLHTNVYPSGDLLGSPSITNNANVQKESSIPPKEIKNVAGLKKNMMKRKLHVPDCNCIVGKKCKMEEYSNEVNEVDLKQVCSNTDENILKRILEEPGCSYVEEKIRKMIECPSCKYKFYIQENETSLPASKDLIPSCTTPISVPSSEIESVFNTPRTHNLKKKLTFKTALAKKRLYKIKNLQQQNKRLKKKNLTLNTITANLKKNGFGDSNLHTALGGFPGDLVCMLQKKHSKTGRSILKFTPSIKKFALTVNYYSAAAYKYIRSELLSCLPHPSTISKWYQSIDGKPGFTKEAFRALQAKFGQSDKKLACLVVDEMAIRQQKFFNGVDVDGVVTHGPPGEIATQAYVLMLVSLNDSFKLPLGYFLVNGFSAEQRSNVILMCLERCHEVGAEVVSLTFDGCPSNFAAAKLLGCNFNDTENLRTYFPHPVTKSPVVVILDPCHMVKLVRNTIEAKKILIDKDGNKIKWQYLENLKNVQDNIGLHFGNKITQRHIQFRNNVMNVKLATQTLSHSVATSLRLCSSDLKLKEFENADAAITFIEIMNNLFDVLNTRSFGGFNFKKPYTVERKEELFEFLDHSCTYLKGLKVDVQNKSTRKVHGEKVTTVTKNQKLLTNTQAKTGFLGLLICISSFKILFTDLIEKRKILQFILPYKFSQDHIELFFGVIRNHGRCNNNPNATQFMGIYKKTLLNLELRSKFTGNCIPIENIPILNCSSAINTTTPGYRHKLRESNNYSSLNVDTEMGNCMAFSNMLDVERQLPDTVELIVAYIGGFVTKKLQTKINCSLCIKLLLAAEKLYFHKLICLKDFGGLAYPSAIVFKICISSESLLRRLVNQEGKRLSRAHNLPVMVSKFFAQIIQRNDILKPLKESHPIESNHDVMLLKAIIEQFLRVRLHYIAKKESLLNTSRQKLNKLTIFRGT